MLTSARAVGCGNAPRRVSRNGFPVCGSARAADADPRWPWRVPRALPPMPRPDP